MTSRRRFLRSLGIGTATATASQWSFGSINAPVLARSLPIDSERLIHLDNNENADGPSSRTVEAIRAALTRVNRYPKTQVEVLTEKIASFHGVDAEQVLEVGAPYETGHIYDSNAFSLAALVSEAGGAPVPLGIAADTVEDLTAKIHDSHSIAAIRMAAATCWTQ